MDVTKLFGDVFAGAVSGGAVAPIISAVDRALAENASGKAKLGESMKSSFQEMMASPSKFFRSPQFFWIWLVYGSTYAAANACTTVCAATDTDVKIPKLMSTFVVNCSTCIMKDKAFATMYGTGVAKPTPAGAYGAWLARDIGSMAVFFTLPPVVGDLITEKFGTTKEKGYYISQMSLPLVLQTVFTPLHLLGYDIYNNPNNSTSQRIEFLKKDYWKNVGMRCVRQAPPWSFGTILNVKLRQTFHGSSSI
eukprot:CAMPEP_0175159284 /NCGR_PEP_ID=MMETSP0087-20121206/23320_1 /TAXON_ID=136419 /ORGANISM="Unknown Unknown, Strain D1" /LENGTH=249 /DNA_ID=CAMNT_0016447283 /DNA_START=22 /DNA_END=771 /DNA_ORIENTATION=-